MTVVLDAYALIAALAGEPAAGEVEAAMREPAARPMISAVNLAEVVDRMVRVWGHASAAVEAALDLMFHAGLTVYSADSEVGLLAGNIRSDHYQKAICEVSMADCFAVATALSAASSLMTSDPAMARVATRIGIPVLTLPDSRGRRPVPSA